MSELKTQITDEDASLVASWRSGDPASFEALVRKHQKRMLNIAFRISGNYEDACEITQDAFVAAYREIGSFRGTARFTTWLTSIVINLARNRRQQVQSRQQHEAWSMNETASDNSSRTGRELPSPSLSAHDRLERLDLHEKLQDCINGLGEEFRETIVLRDLQDSSYGEIGAILKVKEGTVKSRLFRAREMVKDCLKQAVGEL
ncbi:MAG: sigma-70 family RNA polymerase sigma factor [Geobacteraceae bacterium]|nr:sigma-70 family RNA polymerase sigma factor [Geobacteraceae bacterium]